ncbi:hypothetical protein DRN69_01460 [Candidatus Pacearchaeota archaeon]|nr:MAG: hypothetical protein DRN69_01460 [Candidatus Pacearchaeota archaeon]
MKNIKIIVNKEAGTKEISNLRNIAYSCGLKNFSLENNGGSRALGADMPPELFIAINFSIKALAAGFFGAIGIDLWKKIKDFIIKSFKYYENPSAPYLYNPDIYIEIKEENKLKIQILFPTRKFREQELEKSLRTLDAPLKDDNLNESLFLYFSKGKWIISKEEFKNHEESLKEIF